MTWLLFHGLSPDALGLLPEFLTDADPRPAAEQFADRYRFGGWRSNPRAKVTVLGPGLSELRFDSDPGYVWREWARTQLHDETVIVFESDLVVIVQPDGSTDCARID